MDKVPSSSSSNKSRINTNSYATKKTLAQGLFDVALLTSNASQLRRCLTLGDKSKFYTLMIMLIVSSIVLQVIVGALFIYIGMRNIEDEKRQTRLDRLNNATTFLVFIITVINVFILGFGINNEDSMDSNHNRFTN